MRVSERCSCGATFEADDGSRAVSMVYDVAASGSGKWGTSDVEAQARRWRAEHKHEPVVSHQEGDGLLDQQEGRYG